MANQKQKSDAETLRDTGLDAALRLAALREWGVITLTDVATEAGVSLAELSYAFTCKDDILVAYARRIDLRMLAAFPNGVVSGESPKDALFEILMERFDQLNNERAAVLSMLGALRTDPKQWVLGFPHLARSMVWALDACGLDTEGWKGAARLTGLSVIYANALRVWMHDDSADLSKTMAALDQGLSRATSWAERLML